MLGTKAAFVVRELDGQEDALRSGTRPDEVSDWGAEPESRWGRLVSGEETTPVPSERGDWPRFYAPLVRALRDGDPPPVDPHDAVATLRIIEAARARPARGGDALGLTPSASARSRRDRNHRDAVMTSHPNLGKCSSGDWIPRTRGPSRQPGEALPGGGICPSLLTLVTSC